MGGVVGMDGVEEFEKQLLHPVVVEMKPIEEPSETCVMYLWMLFEMT